MYASQDSSWLLCIFVVVITMPQPKKELYNNLKQQGLFTGSYEAFSNAFGSDKGAAALHESLKGQGVTSLSQEDFTNTFFDAEQFDNSYALSAMEEMANPSLVEEEEPKTYEGVGESGYVGIEAGLAGLKSLISQIDENDGKLVLEGESPVEPGARAMAGVAHVTGTAARFLSDVIDDYMPGGIDEEKYNSINKIADPAKREQALRDARLEGGNNIMGALSQMLSNYSHGAKIAEAILAPEYKDEKSMTELVTSGDVSGLAKKVLNEGAQIYTEMWLGGQMIPGAGISGGLAKMSGKQALINIAGRAGGGAEALGIMTYQDSYDENLNAGMGNGIQNFSNSAIKGLAEYGGELVSFKLLDKAMGDAMIGGYGKELATNVAKGLVSSFAQEAVAEGATQVVQDLADMMLQPEGKRPSLSSMVDHTIEAMLLGGFVGGGMTATHTLPAAMQKTIADRSMTRDEKNFAISTVNQINLLNFERQALLDNGAKHDDAAVLEFDAKIEKAENSLKEVISVAYTRMEDMSEKELTNLVRANREVRLANARIKELNRQVDEFEITYGEHEELMKEAIAQLDDAQQNESQAVNQVVETSNERQLYRNINGYNSLPNKGKRVELMDEKDFADFIKLRGAIAEMTENEGVDEGVEELQIQAIEREQGQQDEVSQEDIDAMVDEEITATDVEEGETAEEAATRAAEEAGMEPTGEVTVEETPEGKMVKIGTPRGVKSFTVKTKEDGTAVSVTNTELTPAEEIPVGQTQGGGKMVKVGTPKGVKSLATTTSEETPEDTQETTIDGGLLRNKSGKVVGINVNFPGVQILQREINTHNEKYGGRLGIYGAKMVDGNLHLEMADRQGKIMFDLVVKPDGGVHWVHVGGSGLLNLEYLNAPFLGLIDGMMLEEKRRPVQAAASGWRSRYTERFGEENKAKATNVNDSRMTEAQRERIRVQRGSGLHIKLADIIEKSIKNGVRGGSFSMLGKKATAKPGTMTVTLTSIVVGNVNDGGITDEGRSDMMHFLSETLRGAIYNNLSYGFWVMDNGDIAFDFNIVLDESQRVTALAFATWNNQEAIYHKREDGTEDFPETNITLNEKLDGAKISSKSATDLGRAQAVLNSGQTITDRLVFTDAITNKTWEFGRHTIHKGRSERTRAILKTFHTLFPDAIVNNFDTISDAQTTYPGIRRGHNGQIQSNGMVINLDGTKTAILTPEVIIIINETSNARMGSDLVTAHEVWHSILGAAFAKNNKLLKAFKTAISNELQAAGLTTMDQYLTDFAFQPHYKKTGASYEEYIVEFAGLLSKGLSGMKREAPNSYAAAMYEIIDSVIAKSANYFIGQEVLSPSEVNEKNIISWIATVNDAMMRGGDVSVLTQYDRSGEIPFGDNTSITVQTSSSESTTITNENETFNQFDPEVEVGFEDPFSVGAIEVIPFMADRMATGTYTGLNPESGISIPMQGGVGCPNMKGYFGKIGWFVEGGSIATSLQKGLMRLFNAKKPAYGMPMFMGKEAHMSNLTFAMCFMAECNYLIQSGQKTEQEILDAINAAIVEKTIGKKDLSTKWGIDPKTGRIVDKNKNTGVRVWAKDMTPANSVFADVDGQQVAVAWSEVEPKQVQSLDEWFDIMRTTFDARKAFFAGLYGPKDGKNPGAAARKLGLPDVGKMVELTTDPRSQGLPNGTAISVIEFLPMKDKNGEYQIVFTPEELKVDPHLSYQLGMRGVSKGYLKEPMHIKGMGYESEEHKAWSKENWKEGRFSEAQATSNATRKVTMSVPTMIVNSNEVEYDSMTPDEKADKLKSKVGELLLTGRVSMAGSVAINKFFDKVRGSAAQNANTREAIAELLSDLIGNVTINGKVDLTQDDVMEIMSRAARMNPNGPASIAAFEKYLVRKLNQASKRTAREAAELAREQAKEAKELTKFKEEIIKMLKLNTKRGNITLAQLNTILKRFNRVDFNSIDSLQKFFQYVTKVASNAEYANNLAEARTLQAKIRKAKKSAQIQASTRAIASAFAKLDPRKVTDLDEYLMHAKMIEEAIRTNRFVGFNEDGSAAVTIKDVLPHGPVNEFIEAETAEQEELRRQEFMTKYGELMADGVIDETMTLAEMQQIVTELEADVKAEVNEAKRAAVKKYLTKMLEYQKNRLDEAVMTGIDPETGQAFAMTDAQEKLFNKLFKTDGAISNMTEKEMYKMLESIDNFFENGTTDGIRALVAGAVGRANGEAFKMKVAELGLSLLSGGNGKGMAALMEMQFSSLPIAGSRFFNGVKEWNQVQRLMGLAQFTEGAVQAQMEAKAILDEYIKQFNGEGFMTAENIVARGVLATLLRNVMSSTANQNVEFKRRVEIAKQSAEVSLKDKDPRVKKQAKLAMAAISQLTEDVDSYDEFLAKIEALSTDPNFKRNVDAVKFWQEKWAAAYEKADAVSREVYDTILDQDVSYTPDRMVRTGRIEATDIDEGFFSGQFVPTQQAGNLKKATRPKVLPNGRALSFNFDTNMFTAMETMLVDVYTAEATRQVKEFLKTDGWKNSFNDDVDLTVMEDKIINYMRRARNIPDHNRAYSASDPVVKAVNRVVKMAHTALLTSVFQPLKQVIPVMANTFLNANGRVPAVMMSPDAIEWLSKQPYGINLRGVQSTSDLMTINTALQQEAGNIFGKGVDKLEKYLEWKIKYVVESPDVSVAKASWINYYLDFLAKKEGGAAARYATNTFTFDWKNHKVDKEAAEYAQAMVDRQQNVSDTKLAGEFFQGGSASTIRKWVMPFSTFIINQKQRVSADANILASKTATGEEKVAATTSMMGALAEIFTFVSIKALSLASMAYLAARWAGDDEEEATAEFNKKRDQYMGDMWKVIGTIFTELQPTPPLLDPIINEHLVNKVANMSGYEGDLMYVDKDVTSIEVLFGGMASAYNRFAEPMRITAEAKSGKFEYENPYTKKKEYKYYLPKDRELMQELAWSAWSSWGLTEEPIRLAQKARKIAQMRAWTEKEYLQQIGQESGDWREYIEYKAKRKEENKDKSTERKEAKAKKQAKRQERM